MGLFRDHQLDLHGRPYCTMVENRGFGVGPLCIKPHLLCKMRLVGRTLEGKVPQEQPVASVFSLNECSTVYGWGIPFCDSWNSRNPVLNLFTFFLPTSSVAKWTRATWILQWNEFPNGSLSLFSCSHPCYILGWWKLLWLILARSKSISV